MARKAIRTDKPFSAEGRWWISGHSKKKIPGKFRFDPKSGGTLSLSGSLSFKDEQDVFEKTFTSGVPQYESIMGNTIDGTQITLFDCWVQRTSHLVEGLYANRALIGYHCKSRSIAPFDAIKLRLFNLENWFEHFSFMQPPFSDPKEMKVTLKDSALTKIEGKLESLNATLVCERQLRKRLRQHKANCKYEAEIWIRFNRLQSLDACCEAASKIQNLFTLLTGAPSSSYDFQVAKSYMRATFLAPYRHNVREREKWNGQMPCPYQAIESDFINVVDGWITNYKTLGLVTTLLFEVLKVNGSVLEDKFFNLAQAIEGLCAESVPFEYETDDRYEEFRKAVLAAIPQGINPDLRAKTKSWLKFANNPSLQSYITKLMRPLDSKLKASVLGTWDEKKFIAYVKDTRNIITHPANGPVWKYTNKEQFRDVMDRMKHLLIVLLLQRAGVPLKVLQDNYRDVKGWTWG